MGLDTPTSSPINDKSTMDRQVAATDMFITYIHAGDVY